MIDSQVIRLLAALALAVWPPGPLWCCCLAHEAPEPSAACAAAPAADHCCASKQAAAPAASSSGYAQGCCEDRTLPAGDRACPCLHAPLDAVPTHVAALCGAQGSSASIDLLAPLPHAVPAAAPAVAWRHCPARGSPRAGPLASLHAQCCLLTI